MIKLLKEYIDLLVLEARPKSKAPKKLEPKEVPMADIALFLNGSKALKRERSGGKSSAVGIRYAGGLDKLKVLMSELGADVDDVEVEKPGGQFSISGRYDTYLFSFSPDIATVKWPDGKLRSFVPVSIVDFKSTSALSKAKLLGYGAEHAVYAAVKGLDASEMQENILVDSRLVETIENSSEKDVNDFFQKCASMLSAVSDKLSERDVYLTVENEPPSGGSTAVDVVATDPETGEDYNVHVKYQSDRLVGLQLPKFDKNMDEKMRAAVLSSHPNAIYRAVRDEFSEYPRVIAGMKKNNTSEINAIFLDEALRDSFYEELFSRGFANNINDVLKSQLGLNVVDGVENTLFVNFLSPTNVIVQKLTAKQGKKVTFSVNIPEKPIVSNALRVDAKIKLGKRLKEVQSVLEIEFGSYARRRGLDVHKGENYAEFLDMLQSI